MDDLAGTEQSTDPASGRIASAPRRKSTYRIVKKFVKRFVKRSSLLALIIIFPRTMLVFFICGLYDVLRNTDRSGATIRRYFIGNGALTWAMSPVNVVLDILALPHLNRGVYRLKDLPAAHREELERVIETARSLELGRRLKDQVSHLDRAMVFYKWFGDNSETPLDVPEFHERYRFVRTIGVSIFSGSEATRLHFGPQRSTLRVLCNLDEDPAPGAFIQVGSTVHHWRDDPLFIFDDTLLHRSVNESDQPRACLFVDILRPSPFPWIMDRFVDATRLVLMRKRGSLYNRWTLVR
jgi:aspartyl/asparaginyl beta-hydroxylase (cupin superfamily)